MIRDETRDLGSGQRREKFIGHSEEINICPRSKGFNVLEDFTKGVNQESISGKGRGFMGL